jgi:hypothetical protein
MPAPKKPNTAAATEASLASRLHARNIRNVAAAIALLRTNGYLPLTPQDIGLLSDDKSDAYIAGYVRTVIKARGPAASEKA